MLRTTFALVAVTLLAGAAQAAPAPVPAPDADLVIQIVDDSTSENDAIQLDQGTEPYAPGAQDNPPPSSLPDPAAQEQMNESDVINQ